MATSVASNSGPSVVSSLPATSLTSPSAHPPPLQVSRGTPRAPPSHPAPPGSDEEPENDHDLEHLSARSNLIEDDFEGSSDEVKIFKDEGEDEEKEFASHEELQAALSEDKSSLIQETELSIKQEALRLSDSGKNIPFYLVIFCDFV